MSASKKAPERGKDREVVGVIAAILFIGHVGDTLEESIDRARGLLELVDRREVER